MERVYECRALAARTDRRNIGREKRNWGEGRRTGGREGGNVLDLFAVVLRRRLRFGRGGVNDDAMKRENDDRRKRKELYCTVVEIIVTAKR
jgi:hypothetical protein